MLMNMCGHSTISFCLIYCLFKTSHGTRCAGEVAAKRDNGVCGVGVAYESKVAGKINVVCN